jgi:hypothetical protein
MAEFDNIIFGKKTFSSLLEEIYENQKKKSKQISALISELKPLVESIADATLIVPLIKVATIIQRAMSNTTSSDGGFGISEEEKAQLLAEIEKIEKENK